ncbi:GNAT family N-acetyltransferase [Murinocardiopsis flavida]|nr:GNAT family N-acetyltransferase [Murinocardiopsis flavida]
MTHTPTAPLLPAVVLQTDRLTLRAFTENDIDDVHRGASHPSVQAWIPLPSPGEAYTRADAVEWCLSRAPYLRVSGDGQQWCAIRTDTGAFAGSFGLTRTDWRTGTTEVGYWVDPRWHGNGFAPEAVYALVRWAIEELRFERVELKAAVGNTASRRVAEKTGFSYEGTERNAMPLHAGRTDLAVYSVIAADLARPAAYGPPRADG